MNQQEWMNGRTESDRVGNSDNFNFRKGGVGSIVSASLCERLAGNVKKIECLHIEGSATVL